MELAVAVEMCKWRCFHHINHTEIFNLATQLFHPDFVVETAHSSRTKILFKGKCVWSVTYRPVPGTDITGKKKFREALTKLTGSLAVGAVVVGYGRCNGPNGTIIIHLGNSNCNCIQDFSSITTLFHTELRQCFWYRNYFNFNDCIESMFDLSQECDNLANHGATMNLVVAGGKKSVGIQQKLMQSMTKTICQNLLDEIEGKHYRLGLILKRNTEEMGCSGEELASSEECYEDSSLMMCIAPVRRSLQLDFESIKEMKVNEVSDTHFGSS